MLLSLQELSVNANRNALGNHLRVNVLAWGMVLSSASLVIGQPIHLDEVPVTQSAWSDDAARTDYLVRELQRQESSSKPSNFEVQQGRYSTEVGVPHILPVGRFVGMPTGNIYRLWDLRSGRETFRLLHLSEQEDNSHSWCVAAAPNGILFATGRTRSSLSEPGEFIGIWSLETGELVHRLTKDSISSLPRANWNLHGLRWSPDGSRLVAVFGDGRAVWFDAGNYEVRGGIGQHNSEEMYYQNSKEGWWTTPTDFANDRDLIHLSRGKYNGQESNDTLFDIARDSTAIQTRIAFPDKTENNIRRDATKMSLARGAGFYALLWRNSRDDDRSEVVIRRIVDNSEVRTFSLYGFEPNHLQLAEDGSRVIVGGWRESIILDVTSGKAIGKMPLQNAVSSTRFPLMIGNPRSDTHCVSLWSAEDLREVVRLYPFAGERQWCAVTRTGVLHVSQGVRKQIDQYRYQDNQNYLAAVKCFRDERRMSSVPLVFAGIPPEKAEGTPVDYFPPELSATVVKVEGEKAEVRVQLKVYGKGVTSRSCSMEYMDKPLQESKLTIQLDDTSGAAEASPEDLPAPPASPEVPSAAERGVARPAQGGTSRTYQGKAVVSFPPGKNQLTLRFVATDSVEVVASPALVKVSRSKSVKEATGRLIVLAIGVGKHKYKEYDLLFPGDDARAVASLMNQQTGLQFATCEQQLYVDERATLANIRDGLSWLQRISTPEDLVLIFIAGHGLRGRRGLYYMPHEGDAENLQNTCLNWEEIATTLTNTRARQIVFLSDVCHAGGFAKSELAMQKDFVAGLSKLKNVLVFASSGADELSTENVRLGQGMFTWGLINAFRPTADANRDGALSLKEWVNGTIQLVTRESSRRQNPYIPPFVVYNPDTLIGRLPQLSEPSGNSPNP